VGPAPSVGNHSLDGSILDSFSSDLPSKARYLKLSRILKTKTEKAKRKKRNKEGKKNKKELNAKTYSLDGDSFSIYLPNQDI